MEHGIGPLWTRRPELVELFAGDPDYDEVVGQLRRNYRNIIVTIARWARGESDDYDTD